MPEVATRSAQRSPSLTRAVRQRLGGDVETVGVLPVPDRQRTMSVPAPGYQDFALPVFGAVVAALPYALLAEAPRALEPAGARVPTGPQDRAG